MIDNLSEYLQNIKIRINPNSAQEAPDGFVPWNVDLSPSALYGCSVSCRKVNGVKAPELKWISVKRWVNVILDEHKLPEGCFISIKRRETFSAYPEPRFIKQDYTMIMLPHGNVYYFRENEDPISEDWLLSCSGSRTVLEDLIDRDHEDPVKGYFKSSYDFMVNNPDQIGIHLKRKKTVISAGQESKDG